MKETVRILAALAIAGLIYAYAVRDREPESPSIPVELCKPGPMVDRPGGGRALAVMCMIPVPRSMEAPPRANPDLIF